MSYTTQSATTYIKSMLGYPKRKLELDPIQIEAALKRALHKYGQVKPILRWDWLTVTVGVQGYNLTTLNKKFGKGILRCFFEPITSPQSVFTEFEYYRLRQPPYVDMGELVMDKMFYKEIGLLTGTEQDWDWDQERTMLLITPGPTRAHKLAWEYNHDAAAIEEIPLSGQPWVVDYALALVTKMLGRVRGKFQGVAGNDLPVTTDWSELLSEASTDLKELEDNLWKSRGDWTPPIKG